ncbi:MAG TPA: hypothetical protein VGH28_29205 [Polyangiaceae bacterium]|jgi:hypothetical protein
MMTRNTRHDVLARQSTASNLEIIESGAAAGLIGGVAMALFATIWAGAAGLGFGSPLQSIAATVLHSSGLVHGATGIVIGLAFHLIVSMLFGIIFAWLVPSTVAPMPALAFGLAMGVATLIVMTLFIVPVVNPSIRSALIWGSAPGSLPVAAAFAMHLLYGVGLSFAPGLRRRLRYPSRARSVA